MPGFLPITLTSQLPPIGTQEGPFLEFKTALNRTDGGKKPDYSELAKDLATFANAYGGAILVGAKEGSSAELKEYLPLTQDEADEAAKAYGVAGEQWCFPRVNPAISRLDRGGGFIVAVNIEPRIDTVIGVRFRDNSNTYTFPLRRGRDTSFLTPDELPMQMLPHVRRNLILLEKIGEQRVYLEATVTHFNGTHPQRQEGTLSAIAEASNSFVVGTTTYAIDRIESVFRAGGLWTIVYRYHGAFRRSD